MNLDEYKAGALLTESKIDKISINKNKIQEVIKILIATGNILDQYKKNIFYGKEFDNSKLSSDVNQIQTLSQLIGWDNPYNAHKDTLDIDPRLFHGIVGKTTEAIELLEAIVNFDGNYDTYNICEELGDDSWYTAILVDSMNVNWTSDILEPNYKKLEKRYGKSFSSEAAINRDLDSERQILEDIAINEQYLDGC